MSKKDKKNTKGFVAVWYINIDSVPPNSVEKYMKTVSKSMTKEGFASPFKEMEKIFSAPVVGYFVPRRNFPTELIIKELSIN